MIRRLLNDHCLVELKKMKSTNSTLRSSLKRERQALIDSLEQLIQLLNEKVLTGNVDYYEKFDRARTKLK